MNEINKYQTFRPQTLIISDHSFWNDSEKRLLEEADGVNSLWRNNESLNLLVRLYESSAMVSSPCMLFFTVEPLDLFVCLYESSAMASSPWMLFFTVGPPWFVDTYCIWIWFDLPECKKSKILFNRSFRSSSHDMKMEKNDTALIKITNRCLTSVRGHRRKKKKKSKSSMKKQKKDFLHSYGLGACSPI